MDLGTRHYHLMHRCGCSARPRPRRSIIGGNSSVDQPWDRVLANDRRQLELVHQDGGALGPRFAPFFKRSVPAVTLLLRAALNVQGEDEGAVRATSSTWWLGVPPARQPSKIRTRTGGCGFRRRARDTHGMSVS